MVVLDGNEQLHRYCCSEPIEKICRIIGNGNQSIRCINNPLRGGNQNCKGDKKCALHSRRTHESQESQESRLQEILDLQPITRAFAKSINIETVSG